ncbi:MAG: stage III sporulation protein AB [Acutalibacteraceae bacterium]
MRLLGAGFLWTSLILMGVSYSHKLKKRSVMLENTGLMIDQMKIRLEYLSLPINELVSDLASTQLGRELPFLLRCQESMTGGDDFPEAWQSALEKEALPYSAEEKEKLLQLGSNLGTSDLKGQLSLMEIYSDFFSEYTQIAKSKEKKYGNTAVVLGTLIGSMFFIILI